MIESMSDASSSKIKTTFDIPPWVIVSWPTVLWRIDATKRLQLMHLGTRIVSSKGPGHHVTGQTLWGNEMDHENTAGLAWDWIEVRHNVIALADPMGLVTNLTLLNPQGALVPTLQAAIHLNELVHTLPWQAAVQKALQN